MFNFTSSAYCLELEQTVQTFETPATVGKTQIEGKYLKSLELIQNEDFQIIGHMLSGKIDMTNVFRIHEEKEVFNIVGDRVLGIHTSVCHFIL